MGDIIFQEEKILTDNDIEPAEEIRKRWNENNPDFGRKMRQYNFTIFFCHKPPRMSPNGEKIFLCTTGTADNLYYDYDDEQCDLSCAYLMKSEVKAHEEQHPYLKYPIAKENKPDDENKLANDGFFTADDLCNKWALSPAQLVDIINNYNDFPVYYLVRKSDDCPF